MIATDKEIHNEDELYNNVRKLVLEVSQPHPYRKPKKNPLPNPIMEALQPYPYGRPRKNLWLELQQ